MSHPPLVMAGKVSGIYALNESRIKIMVQHRIMYCVKLFNPLTLHALKSMQVLVTRFIEMV